MKVNMSVQPSESSSHQLLTYFLNIFIGIVDVSTMLLLPMLRPAPSDRIDLEESVVNNLYLSFDRRFAFTKLQYLFEDYPNVKDDYVPREGRFFFSNCSRIFDMLPLC